MSDINTIWHGTPFWIEHYSDNPDAAARYYARLFGWELKDGLPSVCLLHGKPTAGLRDRSLDGGARWITYVAVESVDEVVPKVIAAGGRVLPGPIGVTETDRTALAADDAGAPFGLWERASDSATGRPVADVGALCWTELTTDTPERAQQFYRAVFGWQTTSVEYDDGIYTLWHLATQVDPAYENSIGGLLTVEAGPGATWLPYFATDDVDGQTVRAEQFGATVTMGPFDTPSGRMSWLADPLGASFALLQHPQD